MSTALITFFNILAGLLALGIGVLIIFLPPMIEAYKLMRVNWHRITFLPVFFFLLLSQALIITGLLLLSGAITIPWFTTLWV